MRKGLLLCFLLGAGIIGLAGCGGGGGGGGGGGDGSPYVGVWDCLNPGNTPSTWYLNGDGSQGIVIGDCTLFGTWSVQGTEWETMLLSGNQYCGALTNEPDLGQVTLEGDVLTVNWDTGDTTSCTRVP